MKNRFVCFFIIFLTACSAQKSLIGNYLADGKDYEYSLQLNQDSTFTLTQKYFEADSKCQGKWTMTTKNMIILKCVDETDITNVLTSGYMPDRKKEVLIMNYRKLRLGQVILKKL